MKHQDLPEVVKGEVSEKEWLWLSDEEKQRFLGNLTEPEPEGIIDDV